MKNLILIFMAIISYNICAVEVSDKLLNTISSIESNNKNNAVGDGGKSIGIFQIQKTYVDDVNRILSLKNSDLKFEYKDRFSPQKSKEMVIIFLYFWGQKYEEKTGKKATHEVLARIHNGGPSGYKKKSTISYWRKIEEQLND